jgi:hypothetical protein
MLCRVSHVVPYGEAVRSKVVTYVMALHGFRMHLQRAIKL